MFCILRMNLHLDALPQISTGRTRWMHVVTFPLEIPGTKPRLHMSSGQFLYMCKVSGLLNTTCLTATRIAAIIRAHTPPPLLASSGSPELTPEVSNSATEASRTEAPARLSTDIQTSEGAQEKSAATQQAQGEEGLSRDLFGRVIASLATYLYPRLPLEQAIQCFCDAHLVSQPPAPVPESQCLAVVPSHMDAVPCALVSETCFSFCTDPAQRRWLKCLFLLFSTNHKSPAGNLRSTATTCPHLSLDGLKQLCKDLGLQPKHITANAIDAVFKASHFLTQRELCGLGESKLDQCGRLHFEEFLDAFFRIALEVGGCEGIQPQQGLSFGESYSTDAKRVWLAESRQVCLN
jgi:hypothetical protein